MHGPLEGDPVEFENPLPPGALVIATFGQPLLSNPSGPEYLSVPQTSGICAIFCEFALQVVGTGFALQTSAGAGLGKGTGHVAPPTTVTPCGANVDPCGQNMGVSSVMKYAA